MEFLKKLKEFDDQLQELKKQIDNLKQLRIDWCRENAKEIKKFYPIKGNIYEIIDIENSLKNSWLDWRYIHKEEKYFFKPTLTRFDPQQDFYTDFGDESPTVKGDVLNNNFKEVQRDVRLYIKNLKSSEFKGKTTKVYVMIDKNTGYYKIGRSTNPNFREKTLQSEKPTIEMIFNKEAKHSDEKKLHDMFKESRIRGEWFDLNGSDLLKIKTYLESI